MNERPILVKENDSWWTLPEIIADARKEFKAQTNKLPEDVGISTHALQEKARYEATKLGVNSGLQGSKAKRCIPQSEAKILRQRLITYLHKQSIDSGKRKKLPKSKRGLSASQIEILTIGLVNRLYPDFNWDEWERDTKDLSPALVGIAREATRAVEAVEEIFGDTNEGVQRKILKNVNKDAQEAAKARFAHVTNLANYSHAKSSL